MPNISNAGSSTDAEHPLLIRSYTEAEIRQYPPVLHRIAGEAIETTLSAAGSGYTTFDGLRLNRWQYDPTRDLNGYYLYLRDMETGSYWSATLQPDVQPPDAYRASLYTGGARFERLQDGIRTILQIEIPLAHPLEVRRLQLRNESSRARDIEVTSFLEVVLNEAEADESHPAFSKLFIQTRYDAERHLVRAWRRRRSPDEQAAYLFHASGGDGAPAGFETSRPHFLGRGRNARNPLALTGNAALGGHEGSVLDPAAVLRRTVTMQPGDEATFLFLLGAAREEAAFDDRVLEDLLTPAAPAGSEPARLSRTSDGNAAWITPTDARELESTPGPGHSGPGRFARRLTRSEAGDPAAPREQLEFDNGYGGFSADGTEYVIRMPVAEDGRLRLPPQPWTNVIANEAIGFITSETGAGCTWSRNSRENRLTPWFNDAVSDPHGEAFYIRDEEAGVYWSPLPGPAPAPVPYETRHGLGYSTFRHVAQGLSIEATQFVDRNRPAKVTRIRIRNTEERPRTLSIFSFAELVLGSRPEVTRPLLDVCWDPHLQAVVATTHAESEFSNQHVVAAVRGPGEVFASTDRTAFLGRFGSTEQPAGVEEMHRLDQADERALDPCAALQLRLTIDPQGDVACAFLLADANDPGEAAALLDALAAPEDWDAALTDVRTFWLRTVERLQIQTPIPEIDRMVNGWLPYQNLSCRMRGRTAFYQSGGAFGFRDQLQDASGLLYLDPSITRRQILLHAAHQFTEGDVMHWWHPPTGKGIRTRFSDDLLWLPYIASYYVRSTGDRAVFDERIPFLTGPHLEPGADEVFLQPDASSETGTLYDHCCRAIDRSLATGAHGLPLMGTGDWNDGMNRVGRLGRGESVWLGFFLYHILERFLPYVKERGDTGRAAAYHAHRGKLEHALNDAGWDGSWYRRAYHDDGDPVGSSANDECRIDALVQAWAVMSGGAPEDRAQLALDALEKHLVDEEAGLIRLLTPAFDRTKSDPGYIKGYVPGVRENGGQYTHGVLWAVRALAEAGRGDRATALLRMLSPISHARTKAEADRYRVEPYVIAADVYGEPPHVGRGGWTWYTGSAAWMYRVAVESILGFRLENGSHIVLNPSIDPAWPQFSLSYQVDDEGTSYHISVRCEGGSGHGIRTATLNGDEVPVSGMAACIPLVRDGRRHHVQCVTN